jgi:hypothetical protein
MSGWSCWGRDGILPRLKREPGCPHGVAKVRVAGHRSSPRADQLSADEPELLGGGRCGDEAVAVEMNFVGDAHMHSVWRARERATRKRCRNGDKSGWSCWGRDGILPRLKREPGMLRKFFEFRGETRERR